MKTFDKFFTMMESSDSGGRVGTMMLSKMRDIGTVGDPSGPVQFSDYCELSTLGAGIASTS